MASSKAPSLRSRLPTERGASITQCPVDLPPRALRWALGWIEGVANPLTSIVQILAGSFGWPFLMAGTEAEGDHSQRRQQNSHCVFVSLSFVRPRRPNAIDRHKFPKPRMRGGVRNRTTAPD